jgi:hypothetical protein
LPYAKKNRPRNDLADMNETDRQFHLSLKPNWGPNNTFVHVVPSDGTALADGVVVDSRNTFTSEQRDVKLAKLVAPDDVSTSVRVSISIL